MKRRLDRTFESRTSPCRRLFLRLPRAAPNLAASYPHVARSAVLGRFRVRPSPPSRAHPLALTRGSSGSFHRDGLLHGGAADARARAPRRARRRRPPRPATPPPSPRAAGRPLAPPAAARLRRSRRGAARSSPRATPAPPPPPRAPPPRAPPRARLLPPPPTTRRASPWTTSCGTPARSRATFASSRAARGTARCATSRT